MACVLILYDRHHQDVVTYADEAIYEPDSDNPSRCEVFSGVNFLISGHQLSRKHHIPDCQAWLLRDFALGIPFLDNFLIGCAGCCCHCSSQLHGESAAWQEGLQVQGGGQQAML